MSLAPVLWRLVLCDLWGKPISMLDGIAFDVEMTYRLNRPASCTFKVPSEDPRVNALSEADIDGTERPYLDVSVRVVKAYRKTATSDTLEAGGWVLQGVFRVWTLEDQGDGDTATTQVTCYDPLKILEKRIIRHPNSGRYDKAIEFHNRPADEIIWELCDATIDFAGPIHILCPTSGFFPGQCSEMSVGFDQEYVLPGIIRITDTLVVDLIPIYLEGFGELEVDDDLPTRDGWNGRFMQLAAGPKRSVDQTATALFAYAASPYSASEFVRTKSMDDLVNTVIMFGKSVHGKGVSAHDQDSMDLHLAMESLESVPDIGNKDILDYLVNVELALRKDVRDLVTIVPTPENSSQPFEDYDVGDTVSVVAATAPYPVTREIVSGVQRLYGFTIALDNDFGEHVSEMIVAPDSG